MWLNLIMWLKLSQKKKKKFRSITQILWCLERKPWDKEAFVEHERETCTFSCQVNSPLDLNVLFSCHIKDNALKNLLSLVCLLAMNETFSFIVGYKTSLQGWWSMVLKMCPKFGGPEFRLSHYKFIGSWGCLMGRKWNSLVKGWDSTSLYTHTHNTSHCVAS